MRPRPIDCYFTIGNVGFRIWYPPKFWAFNYHKRVLDLGPLSIYWN